MSWVGGKAVVYTGLVILKQFIRVLCLDMMTHLHFLFIRRTFYMQTVRKDIC